MNFVIAEQNYIPYHFFTTCQKNLNTKPYSHLYKLTSIILDIDQHRLFVPVTIRGDEKFWLTIFGIFSKDFAEIVVVYDAENSL
jgi:hypothetical protein